jgi:hypothetical protein
MFLRNVPFASRILGLSGLFPFAGLALGSHFVDLKQPSTKENQKKRLNESPATNNTVHHALSTIRQTMNQYYLTWDSAQRAYGACILSFMGAVHWGLEMAEHGGRFPTRYAVSVLPSLLATVSLLLPRMEHGLVVEAAGLVGLLAYDIWSVRRGRVMRWYLPLRVSLTAGAVTSLCLTKVSSNGNVAINAFSNGFQGQKSKQDNRSQDKEDV